MGKSKVLAAVALLIAMAGDVFAVDLSEWKHRAEVTIEDGAAGYCRLTLTPEIFDAARRDLADVRLIGAGGEQIPYVLHKPEDVTKKLKYEPAIINRSTNSYKASMVTLDFGERVMKNSIEVETSGHNFRRTVKVDGSNDNIEFFMLVDRGYVFAVPDHNRYSRIDLPVNDYRYLRITVEPMATEQRGPAIEEVKAFKVEKSFAERGPAEMICLEHEEDKKSNSSIYVYDFVYRHLPISEIELDVADDSFYRYVTVEGRDSATLKVKVDSEDNRQRFREVEVKWERITSDTIYRYTAANGRKHKKLVLRIPSGRRVYRYLRITIKNYDDKPVIVRSASAEMTAHQLVFAAQDNTVATLYVGSESAKKPRYDLEHRLSRLLQVKARTAKLGRVTDNPLFGQGEKKSVAWTERHKVLLLIVLGAMVLVLGVFILKSLRSIQSEHVRE